MKQLLKDNTGPALIKVLGVGGGGSNAVNHMFRQGIVGVDFAICNTDAQSMAISPVPTKIQLGPSLTDGRGAGSKPNVGREACIESLDDLKLFFQDTKMLFITAGMGGGTGTGAAPIIAKAAQELDILTVAIVTVPFLFEGRTRLNFASEGLAELKKNVDTIIVISNDKLRQLHGNLSLGQAFAHADNVLTTAAKGIAEIITVPGYVNVDFEDVNTVMRGSGAAVMGTATVEGQDRARRAVEAALQSPLLEDNDIRGAQHILLNISSGKMEVTMDEVFEITEYIQEEAGQANLIWGNCFDESLGDKLSVTVIATGFDQGRKKATPMMNQQQQFNNRQPQFNEQPQAYQQPPRNEQVRVSLDDVVEHQKPKDNFFDLGADKKEETQDNSFTFEFDAKANFQPKQGFKTVFPDENQPIAPRNGQPPVSKPKEHPLDASRLSRLRELSSVNFHSEPNALNEMENEPAYLRKNVRLDNVPHSSEPKMSKWSLPLDDDLEFKENNSFLHDNAD